MVHISSFLAGLSILLSCSAIPLTIPLGTSGQSLTVSGDGQSISVGGQTVTIAQAMNGAKACQAGKGKGGKARNGSAAAEATTAKVVYFISNAANNSIVAMKVGANGSLSDGSVTPTGGAGMSGVNATGGAAAPDSLFSQGSIKISGNVRSSSLFTYLDANTPTDPHSSQSWLKHHLHVPDLFQ